MFLNLQSPPWYHFDDKTKFLAPMSWTSPHIFFSSIFGSILLQALFIWILIISSVMWLIKLMEFTFICTLSFLWHRYEDRSTDIFLYCTVVISFIILLALDDSTINKTNSISLTISSGFAALFLFILVSAILNLRF